MLGNRRLSIIDVAGGHQPIANEDGTIWVVFNGEIYNFQALRDAPRSSRPPPRHAPRHRDASCISTRSWATSSCASSTACSRWRCGTTAASGCARARSLRQEAAALCRSRRPALVRLGVPGAPGRSGDRRDDRFRRARRVPVVHVDARAADDLPADSQAAAGVTCWSATRAGTRVSRYWSLAYTPKLRIDEDEAIARGAAAADRGGAQAADQRSAARRVPERRRRFERGRRDHGRLDRRSPVKTFSIGFDEARFNELPHARRVAERYGCEHHEFEVRPRGRRRPADARPALRRAVRGLVGDSQFLPVAADAAARDRGAQRRRRRRGIRRLRLAPRRAALAERWQRVPAPLRTAAERSGVRPDAAVEPIAARRRRASRGSSPAPAVRAPRAIAPGCRCSRRSCASELYGGRSPRVGHRPARADLRAAPALDGVDAMLRADVDWYSADRSAASRSTSRRWPIRSRDDRRSSIIALTEFVGAAAEPLQGEGQHLEVHPEEGGRRPRPGREPAPRRSRASPCRSAPWFRGELKEMLADHLLSPRFAAARTVRAARGPAAVRRSSARRRRLRASSVGAADARALVPLLHRQRTGDRSHDRGHGAIGGTALTAAATSSASRRSTGTSLADPSGDRLVAGRRGQSRAVRREHRRARARRRAISRACGSVSQLVAQHQGVPRGQSGPLRLFAAVRAVPVFVDRALVQPHGHVPRPEALDGAPPASARPVVWTFLPTPRRSDLIAAIDPAAVVYYCIDDFASTLAGRAARQPERAGAVPARRSRLRHLRAAAPEGRAGVARPCTRFRPASISASSRRSRQRNEQSARRSRGAAAPGRRLRRRPASVARSGSHGARVGAAAGGDVRVRRSRAGGCHAADRAAQRAAVRRAAARSRCRRTSRASTSRSSRICAATSPTASIR